MSSDSSSMGKSSPMPNQHSQPLPQPVTQVPTLITPQKQTQQHQQIHQQTLFTDKYAPGTIISIGIHKVEIVTYLAEGGFAKIYVAKFLEYLNEMNYVQSSTLVPGNLVCLKRVLVQDENGLNEMRNEVGVMKKLKNAPCIVQYYDSNASRKSDGSSGFEVLLLMEFCSNKSLLDYMNQRLTTKLNEREILKIMFDITLGVAQMHYLPTPLIHRDIKIENVLVDAKNNFKLCDFGSTSLCMPIVSSHQDISILTQNIYIHTTPQYRSPEMIDIYRCLPVDEKSDIWALGVFLYKLLFYTTPFERTGQFAILHSKYEFPVNNYSSKLINLIIIMLSENPNLRPNIYQVLHYICDILGKTVPLDDIYCSGPYSFQKYTDYQSKLQNCQNQMFQIQVKKFQNKGILNPSDEMMLDNLFVSSFEVAPKVPVTIGYPDISGVSPMDNNLRTNYQGNNRISEASNNSFNSNISLKDATPVDNTINLPIITSNTPITSGAYPSILTDSTLGATNDYTTVSSYKNDIVSSTSRGGGTTGRAPVPGITEVESMSAMSGNVFRSMSSDELYLIGSNGNQHKPNNPFPKLAADSRLVNTLSHTNDSTPNSVFLTAQQQSQQPATSYVSGGSNISFSSGIGTNTTTVMSVDNTTVPVSISTTSSLPPVPKIAAFGNRVSSTESTTVISVSDTINISSGLGNLAIEENKSEKENLIDLLSDGEVKVETKATDQELLSEPKPSEELIESEYKEEEIESISTSDLLEKDSDSFADSSFTEDDKR